MNEFTWNKVSQERYDEMLCVLPPIKRAGQGFLVGEAVTHRTCYVTGVVLPTYYAYDRIHSVPFEGPDMTIPEFEQFRIGAPP